MRLTASVHVNRKGLGIEGRAIYCVRYPAIEGIAMEMEEYTIESVIRGHHVYIIRTYVFT